MTNMVVVATQPQLTEQHEIKWEIPLTIAVSNSLSTRSSEQRTETRFAVALPATAVISDKDHSVRLINVAMGGAMFETSASLPAGTRLVFRSGTIVVGATVAWQIRDATGVYFDCRLSDRDVGDQISRNAAIALRREFKLQQI